MFSSDIENIYLIRLQDGKNTFSFDKGFLKKAFKKIGTLKITAT